MFLERNKTLISNLSEIGFVDIKELVKLWYDKWEEGDFQNIPVEDDFTHTSPFGVIDGKEAYLEMVEVNQDSFLGHRFEIHDTIYADDHARVRYTTHTGDFSMDVSEWFYKGETYIKAIVSYYNVGNVSYDQMNQPEK